VVVDLDGDGDGTATWPATTPFLRSQRQPTRTLRARIRQATSPRDASWVVHGAASDPFTATSHVAVAVHAHDYVNDHVDDHDYD
jgi:hypothetical protein